MTTFHIISLFSESFESYLKASIVKRALEKGIIAVKYYNPRDFAVSKKKSAELTYAERRVDDRPYGGGPGMVIEALPVIRSIEKAVGRKIRNPKNKKEVKIIFFSPAGKEWTNDLAEKMKNYSDIVLICGRYEGIDARIKKVFPMVDISVGPYVLTGGELPAMIVIDSLTRRIPGVLGHDASIEESRIASPDVYTRPGVIKYKNKLYRVPKVLLSGNHAEMNNWKLKRKQ